MHSNKLNKLYKVFGFERFIIITPLTISTFLTLTISLFQPISIAKYQISLTTKSPIQTTSQLQLFEDVNDSGRKETLRFGKNMPNLNGLSNAFTFKG